MILDTTLNGKTYTLINTYMPINTHPKDQVQCLKFIQDNLNELNNDYIILGGDLNIQLDHKLDR